MKTLGIHRCPLPPSCDVLINGLWIIRHHSRSSEVNTWRPINTLVTASWLLPKTQLPARDRRTHGRCCSLRCSGKMTGLCKQETRCLSCGQCERYKTYTMHPNDSSILHVLFTQQPWTDPGDPSFPPPPPPHPPPPLLLHALPPPSSTATITLCLCLDWNKCTCIQSLSKWWDMNHSLGVASPQDLIPKLLNPTPTPGHYREGWEGDGPRWTGAEWFVYPPCVGDRISRECLVFPHN